MSLTCRRYFLGESPAELEQKLTDWTAQDNASRHLSGAQPDPSGAEFHAAAGSSNPMTYRKLQDAIRRDRIA